MICIQSASIDPNNISVLATYYGPPVRGEGKKPRYRGRLMRNESNTLGCLFVSGIFTDDGTSSIINN